MYVANPCRWLIICEWSQDKLKKSTIDSPTWSDVENAVRGLDSDEFNDIYIYSDRKNTISYLCIGGGDVGYIATGNINNDRFPTWVDPSKSEEPEVELVVGGQSVYYPNSW